MKYTFTFLLFTMVLSISLHSFKWPYRDLDVRGIVSSSSSFEDGQTKRENLVKRARRIQNSKHVILDVRPRTLEIDLGDAENEDTAEIPNKSRLSSEDQQKHTIDSIDTRNKVILDEESNDLKSKDERLHEDYDADNLKDLQNGKRSYHDLSCSPCRSKKYSFSFKKILIQIKGPSYCSNPCG